MSDELPPFHLLTRRVINDLPSQQGRFGWRKYAEDDMLLYIFRGNEEYVPLRLVLATQAHVKYRALPEAMTAVGKLCESVNTAVTEAELTLLNSIIDDHAPHIGPHFSSGDELVRLKDAEIAYYIMDMFPSDDPDKPFPYEAIGLRRPE